MRLRAPARLFLQSVAICLFIVMPAFPAQAHNTGKNLATVPHAALGLSAAPRLASRPGQVTLPNPVPTLSAKRYGLSFNQQRVWLVLGLAQHGAAFFDARTTREAMNHYRELDPLLRPFAHSAALYPVMQIAPAGLDWLALRLAGSRHPWLRRLWWLPQTAAAAGFVWSGVHNLRLPASSSR